MRTGCVFYVYCVCYTTKRETAGHYEWLRLPMGLRNNPLTFKSMINTLFAGIIGNGLFVYRHDLIFVSKDLDSHLMNLSLVFQKLTQAGIK